MKEKLFTVFENVYGPVALAFRPIELDDLQVLSIGGNRCAADVVVRIKPLCGSALVAGMTRSNWDYLEPMDCAVHINFAKQITNGPNMDERIKKRIAFEVGDAYKETLPCAATLLSAWMSEEAVKAAQKKFDALRQTFNEKTIEHVERMARTADTQISCFAGEEALVRIVRDAKETFDMAQKNLHYTKDVLHAAALNAMMKDLAGAPISQVLDMKKLAETKRERGLFN